MRRRLVAALAYTAPINTFFWVRREAFYVGDSSGPCRPPFNYLGAVRLPHLDVLRSVFSPVTGIPMFL